AGDVAFRVQPGLHLYARHAAGEVFFRHRTRAWYVARPHYELDAHFVAHFPAEELIHRHVRGLPRDVPQCHLHGTLRERVELDDEVHRAPRGGDVARVFANELRRDVVADGRDRAQLRLAGPQPGDSRLA